MSKKYFLIESDIFKDISSKVTEICSNLSFIEIDQSSKTAGFAIGTVSLVFFAGKDNRYGIPDYLFSKLSRADKEHHYLLLLHASDHIGSSKTHWKVTPGEFEIFKNKIVTHHKNNKSIRYIFFAHSYSCPVYSKLKKIIGESNTAADFAKKLEKEIFDFFDLTKRNEKIFQKLKELGYV